MKNQTLRNEMAGLARHYDSKQAQLMQNHQNDVQLREQEAAKLHETIARMESQLRGK